MPISDPELLRAFAESGDASAFAELVQRRIDFVYAAALRQLAGDAHRARDITQEVFIKLARDARKLSRHPALLGWLCTATRFAAIDAIRSERARKNRETEANAMQHHEAGREIDWERLQPVLDEALTELRADDREAVLARYFDRQPFARIAESLGVSENAAQRRVERALDKLHAALARRQITSTSAALGAVLATHSGIAAPAGLAVVVTQSALAGSVGAATATGWGLFTFMSSAKITLALAGTFAALGIGAAYLGATAASDAQTALTLSTHNEAALLARVRELETRVQSADQRVQLAEVQNAKLLADAANPRATQSGEPVEAEPITSGVVSRRFKRAQELVASGDAAEALRELIWCYDVGMPKVPSMRAVRSSFGVSLFVKLGERHPPALDALRDRRDQARQRLASDDASSDATKEFATINRALNNDAENMALFDQLPPGDKRRQPLASASYDYLVENRRYREALLGRSYILAARRTWPPRFF
jgi:RNA polymerase sigma factor (sigma-70 family)